MQKKFTKRLQSNHPSTRRLSPSGRSIKSVAPPALSGSVSARQQKLKIEEDGEIIFDGDHKNLEALFGDGVVRIKQAPPVLDSESPQAIKELVNKHNVPIKKQ